MKSIEQMSDAELEAFLREMGKKRTPQQRQDDEVQGMRDEMDSKPKPVSVNVGCLLPLSAVVLAVWCGAGVQGVLSALVRGYLRLARWIRDCWDAFVSFVTSWFE